MHPSILVLFSFVSFAFGIEICPTREVTLDKGEITSPGYPQNYPSNTDCTLTLKQPLDTDFIFTFTTIDIEGDEDSGETSCYDSLKISGQTSKDFCGTTTPAPFTPGFNVITLRMESDDSVQQKGFNLSFTTVKKTGLPPAVSICPTRTITPSATGRVHSPGFASSYVNSLDCKLTLDVPSNKEIEITYGDRDIEYVEKCGKDKLAIDDGRTSIFTCGQGGAGTPKKFSNGDVSLHFTTDGSGTGRGFILNYTLIDKPVTTCSCPNGNSYIKRGINKNNVIKRKDDDISLEFKTSQKEGLFLYGKGGDRDFILLKLEKGNIVFECDLGTGNSTMRVPTASLDDNAWHKVVVERRSKNVKVTVDSLSQVLGQTAGSFGMLDIKPKNGLSAAMYALGGPSGIRYSTNFQGCIRNFEIDGMKPVEAYLQNDPEYTMYGSTSMGQC